MWVVERDGKAAVKQSVCCQENQLLRIESGSLQRNFLLILIAAPSFPRSNRSYEYRIGKGLEIDRREVDKSIC